MEKIVVSGSKGGSQKPKQPYEMEDNLVSINKIKVLLAVSDGEIEDTFSLKNLYFDDVPVENPDGTVNYPRVTADFRNGTQTQDVIAGFQDSASEVTVSRPVKYDTPFNISITDKNLSALRFRVLMPRGLTVKPNGDRVGVNVEYKIDLAVDGAPFVNYATEIFNGKSMNGYDRSTRVNLPEFNTQIVARVRRVTPDQTDSNIVDEIRVQSYSEVIDAKFRYPLTGLVYVEFDSELFTNQMPRISIRKKWKLINVPENYNPESREYSGSWNGVFKKAWSNNPAWVLYDLITNQRYGLDQRELGIPVDKWSLYEAGQYCDQKVPDGRGGTEPRYLCDMVIQSQVEAYTLIRDVCSIFRGLSFWNGESLSIVIDKPRDPSYIFTNDNVVNGDFGYTFASEKSMYSRVDVMFDDKENNYQQDVEGVFDPEIALRFGGTSTGITAIGCTRRSEANRRGRWIIKTNTRSKTVSFATGLEGMIPMVGDVIAVSDNFESSNLMLNVSGRVMEVSGLQIFTMFKIDARAGDLIMINKPDGKPEKRTIASVSPDGKTITLNIGFSFTVKPNTVFAIDRKDLALQQYVVTTIKKGDSGGDDEFVYSVSAVEYDPNKYDSIDYGVNIEDRPTSVVDPDNLGAPDNVKVDSYSRVVQGASVETMVVSWDKVEYASFYEVQWRKENGNWNNIPRTAAIETQVEGIYSGNYQVRVRAISSGGNSSVWSEVVNKALTGKVGEPSVPLNLTASTDEVFGIRVKWAIKATDTDTAYIELQQSSNGTEATASLVSLIPYPQREYWHSILPAGFVNFYRIRSVDKIGNVSGWTAFVRGMSSDDVSVITDHIKIDIEGSEGFKNLQENALDTNAKVKNIAESIIENALANDSDVRRVKVEMGNRKAEHTQVLTLISTEQMARATSMNQLKAQIDNEVVAQITDVKDALATETEARVNQVNQINVKFGTVDSDISNVDGKVNTVDGKVNTANGKISAVEGDITRLDKGLASETQARVSADTALSARVGTTEAGLNQKLDSWVENGSIGAQYSVKLGIRRAGVDYSAGMAMSLISDASGIKSQMLFQADRFAILSGNLGGAYSLPFVVEGNQVFINSLLVKDGSISNAKIGNTIQSNNYVSNQTGWQIDKNTGVKINGSTAGQGRVTIDNDGVSVYDAAGKLRVKMGKL